MPRIRVIMVHAAIIQNWGESPDYSEIDLPEPTATQVRIKVLAAALHPLVRSRATGQHFSVAHSVPPRIPGTDGVGIVVPKGELVYFNCMTAPTGSFADEINIEKRDIFTLPAGADLNTIAVLANTALSS